jgi:hypothetical protein
MQLTIKKFNDNSMQIEDCGISVKWNNDNEPYNSLNDWMKDVTPKIENKIEYIGIKNAIDVGKNVKKNDLSSLAVLMVYGNNCQYNLTHNSILSINFDNAGGGRVFIYPQNIDRVIISYSARSLIQSTWLNNNDEYRVPSEQIQSSDKYKQFNNDCYVYSLFSLQSSMRHILNFDNTYFNIFNHFFYMSNKEMKDLADQYNFKELYDDADEFYQDRFIYKRLSELTLSPDAQEILEELRKLTRDSMKYRELAHQEDEKYHLNCWDAGWYQIRMGILKKYMKEELKEFMVKFKQFESRLRPMVYEFGFLPHENKIDSSKFLSEI